MDKGLIFDVGMCDGADTAFYLAKGFRVVAVEANPSLVKTNKNQFARHIASGRLIIINKAIGESAGRKPFHVHAKSIHWSSLRDDLWSPENSAFDTIEVETVRLDTVVREYGTPHYLKIDIEALDLCAVESLVSLSAVERPRYVSAEAHSPKIVESLYEQGYRRFKLIDQIAHHKLRMWPWKWREGRFVWAKFTDSHSGPFGEETPGQWLDRDDVLAEYHALHSVSRLTWHDFHAALPA